MDAKQEISTDALQDWLNRGKAVSILDIRPSAEREEWSIPGSLYLDVYDKVKGKQPDALSNLHLDKKIPVVTVCGGGKTSLIAAEMLQKSGYEAYSLQGGMKAWSVSWNTARLPFPNFEIVQFRRTGKGCLSYLVVSKGEAMVIDASLPIEVYQGYLKEGGLTLKAVADTHLHADHLTRSKQLAKAYGMEIYLPENEKVSYPFSPVKDGAAFAIGDIKVKAIHTPGHTPESTSYMVNNQLLLTGDTLFVNGVGRPDLKADRDEAVRKSRELFHSLKKIFRLGMQTIVMPGHTSIPVDFDGIPIMVTLEEILHNVPMLRKDEEEFVETLLQRIPPTPSNYLVIAERNLSGDFSGIDPIVLEAGANRCAIS